MSGERAAVPNAPSVSAPAVSPAATLRTAFVLLVLLTLLTGVLYPLAVTLAAQALFPHEANGSVIDAPAAARSGGNAPPALGSELIGQASASPRDFWSRPSATARVPYDAAASSGSNLGPLNPALREAVAARVATLRAMDPGNSAPIPVDLVTASASGLDPHISPAAAAWQAGRVARARGLPVARVLELLAEHTTGRFLGVFGEPRVNVLLLNLALDAQQK